MVTFVYGPHAADMLAERSIDPLWIERAVLRPEAVEPDPKHPTRTRAFSAVPEREGRVLRVVYERADHHRVPGPRSEAARMKTKYDPASDALYVRFADAAVVETEEVRPGVMFDFDSDGRIVAIEVLDASEHISAPSELAKMAAAESIGRDGQMTTWIAAAMSLLGVLIGATLQYAFNRHIEARKVLAAQKALAYTDFFKAVAGLAQERSVEFLALAASAKTRVCLFRTKEVVQALTRFEGEGAIASSAEGQHALLSLLNVMRRDLLGSRSQVVKEDVTTLMFGVRQRPH